MACSERLQKWPGPSCPLLFQNDEVNQLHRLILPWHKVQAGLCLLITLIVTAVFWANDLPEGKKANKKMEKIKADKRKMSAGKFYFH